MLLVGEDSPREDDDAWRVPKGTDAAPRPGHPPAVVRGAETWKSLRESGSPGPSSPPRTAAIQLRASALEDVVNRARAAHRDGKPLPREAAQDACSRCLEAAGRNLDADAKGCAARNLLEAGFFCRSAEVDTESAVDARPDRMVEELRGFFEALAPEGIELDVETRRARLDGLDESARSELKVRLRRVGLHHFADMLESTIR